MPKRKNWGGKKITEIIKDAEQKQQNIGSLLERVREKASQIESAFQQASEKLSGISSNAANADTIVGNIENTKNEVQQIKDEVVELKVTTRELVETNQSLLEETKNQLAVVAGGVLSNTFEGRRQILGKSATIWFRWLLFDILALILVAVIVFLELKTTQNLTTGFFLKFSLSFPFIYGAFFFHGQYSKERDLEEDYAFKSAVSFSLEAYRKLLKGEIDNGIAEERNKLLDFIINTVKNIYTSPGSGHTRKKNRKVSSDALDDIKEILKNITDLARR